MAQPITWKSVTAPNQNGSNQLTNTGLEALLGGFRGLGDRLQKPLKDEEQKQKEAFEKALQLAALNQAQQRIDNQSNQFGVEMDFKQDQSDIQVDQFDKTAAAKVLAAKQGFEWNQLTAKQKNDWQVTAATVLNTRQNERQDVANKFTTQERLGRQGFTSSENAKSRSFTAGQNAMDRAIQKAQESTKLSPEAKADLEVRTYEAKRKLDQKYPKDNKKDTSLSKLMTIAENNIKDRDLSGDEAQGARLLAMEADIKGLTPVEFQRVLPTKYNTAWGMFGANKLEEVGQTGRSNILKPNNNEISVAQQQAKDLAKNLQAAKERAANLKKIRKGVFIPK